MKNYDLGVEYILSLEEIYKIVLDVIETSDYEHFNYDDVILAIKRVIDPE
jgi:hypothetical protein